MENGSIKAGDPGEASGHESRTAVLRDYWPHWSDCFTMSERRNRLAWEVFFFLLTTKCNFVCISTHLSEK